MGNEELQGAGRRKTQKDGEVLGARIEGMSENAHSRGGVHNVGASPVTAGGGGSQDAGLLTPTPRGVGRLCGTLTLLLFSSLLFSSAVCKLSKY